MKGADNDIRFRRAINQLLAMLGPWPAHIDDIHLCWWHALAGEGFPIAPSAREQET